jgi:hypothetical protein
MINFAELKLKLCEFKKTMEIEEFKFVLSSEPTNIISQLLDVIRENLMHSNMFIEQLRSHGKDVDVSYLMRKYDEALSETESKLKQLIKGE